MLIPFFLFMDIHEQNMGMKSLSQADRPREKLLLNGSRHLSDSELMAILIGSGTANESAVTLSQRLLSAYDNRLSEIGSASVKELCNFKGIGEVKALSIVAALELGRRRIINPSTGPIKITGSQTAFEVLRPALSDLNHEEFWILMLNAANVVKDKVMVSRGGLKGTIADPKMIFKKAMEHNAASIILAHNHPSGNRNPSEADIAITKKLKQGGLLLDLYVLDHLIIAGDVYTSLADEGII